MVSKFENKMGKDLIQSKRLTVLFYLVEVLDILVIVRSRS